MMVMRRKVVLLGLALGYLNLGGYCRVAGC